MDVCVGRKLSVLVSRFMVCVFLLLIVQTGYADQQSLGQKIFKRGDYTVHLGIFGSEEHKLPVGVDKNRKTLFNIGERLSMEHSKKRSGSLRTQITRIVFDSDSESVYSLTSIVASRGIGFDINKNRYLGFNADASVGAGLTRMTVRSDSAITPVAELAISISVSLSRFVMTMGGHYRQTIAAKVDGHRYGPPSSGGHFSFGFGF